MSTGLFHIFFSNLIIPDRLLKFLPASSEKTVYFETTESDARKIAGSVKRTGVERSFAGADYVCCSKLAQAERFEHPVSSEDYLHALTSEKNNVSNFLSKKIKIHNTHKTDETNRINKKKIAVKMFWITTI